MKRTLSIVLALVMVLSMMSFAQAADTLTYAQSSYLDGKDLPAIEDRIPDADNIFVETTASSGEDLAIGTYASTLTVASTGVGNWGISRYTMESVVKYNTDNSRYANVIKSYEANDDYTVWTWHLREGMRWSDGTPFTADDITYWYYMCHVTDFDGQAKWSGLYTLDADGNRSYAKLEKVDDYTLTWTFDAPNYEADFFSGDFKFAWVCSHVFIENGLFPSSYYKENDYYADPGLTDEQVLANALKLGLDFTDVKTLGKQIIYYYWNYYQIPNLDAWKLTSKEGNNTKDSDLIILERNPYYFKVDAAGNQLPYIDEIHIVKVTDDDQAQLMFLSGELDYYGVAINDIASLMEKMGDAVTLKVQNATGWGTLQFNFNLTIEDDNYFALFNNADFRQAMSIAIDRNAVSELLYDGFLAPKNTAPQEGNFGYSEELAQHWAEYDVEKAKTLLEGTGLLTMGSDGYYDFADGTDLMIEVLIDSEKDTETNFAVVNQYWDAIGIKCATKVNEDRGASMDANDYVAIFGAPDALGGIGLISRPKLFLPDYNSATWTGNWYTYFADETANAGTHFEPVDDGIKEIVKLGRTWSNTADQATRDEIELQIYDLIVAGGYTISITEEAGSYYLVKSSIQNWFDNISEDKYFYINLAHPECWFYAE